MKKIISMLLVGSIILSMSATSFAAYDSNPENTFAIELDGETYTYEVLFNEDTTMVQMWDGNGELEEVFTRVNGSNQIFLHNANCLVEVNMTASEVVTPQSGVYSLNTRDYIEGEFQFTVADLCSAVGIAINMSTFIGIILVASTHPVCIINVKTVLAAVLDAAAQLSLSFGGLVTNHGAIIYYRAYEDRVCRGSECFVGYFDYDFYDYELY